MKIVVLDGYHHPAHVLGFPEQPSAHYGLHRGERQGVPGGPAPERGEQVIRLPQEKQVVEK